MFRRRSSSKRMRQPAELAPFPMVALRVLQLAAEDDPDRAAGPTELIDVVRTDAAISARILRLANSSLYGFRHRIVTLQAAGMALGTEKLIEIVLASAVSLYHAPRGHLQERQSVLLWRRSLCTALAAQELAPARGVDPARAFFAGLFLSLGLLRFHQVYPPRILARVRTLHAEGLDGPMATRRVFGLDHVQEGARLVRDWGLPSWIAASMEDARAARPSDLVGACLRDADVSACALLLEDGELGEEDYWTIDATTVAARVEDPEEEALRAFLRERTRTFDQAA